MTIFNSYVKLPEGTWWYLNGKAFKMCLPFLSVSALVSSKVARANWQHGAEACQRGLHEAGMRDVGRTVDIWRNGSKEWMVNGWLSARIVGEYPNATPEELVDGYSPSESW